VPAERKGEHAVEVDVLEPHRRQVSCRRSIDLTLPCGLPTIKSPLHLVCVPGHHQIRHECERARLCAQLLGSAATPGPTTGTPDLPLE